MVTDVPPPWILDIGEAGVVLSLFFQIPEVIINNKFGSYRHQRNWVTNSISFGECR
jgi:hypothetical protein